MNTTLLDTQINSKDLKILSKKFKYIKDKDSKDFCKQIIDYLNNDVKDEKTKSFLLEQFSNLSKDFKVDQKIIPDFSKKDLNQEHKNEEENEEGEVLVEDLLKLSFMTKNDIDIKNFSTDNNKLKTSLSDKKTVLDFKDAKNVKDLLDIAKNKDIKIKEFEFLKEESTQSFQLSHEKQNIKNIKSEDILKIIDKKLENSLPQLTDSLKNNKNHIKNTLKNILSSIDIRNTKEQTTTILSSSDHEKNKVVEPKSKKEVFISNKYTIKTDISTISKQNIEFVQVSKEISTKDSSNKIDNNIQDIQTISKVKTIHVNSKHINSKDFEKNLQIINKKDEKDEKDEKNFFIKNSSEDTQKIQTLQKSNKQQKQTIYINKTNTIITSNKNETNEKQDVSFLEEKSHHDSRVEHSLTTHKLSLSKAKSDVKHTLNTFAQDFKEQVESYKPPLMKVKMQLNPKGLGDVDITMINRGNNLHITVNSNPNTIAIFSQNQTEFKNALVGMGFSELNMSFNENGKNRDNSQNQKNKSNSIQSFEDENHEDSFEMTTPIYI